MAQARWLSGAARLAALGLALGLAACGSAQIAPTPVGEQQVRSVLSPSRFGWLSSEQASDALPSAIALGGKTSGRVLLYFEFAAPSEPRRLLRADLVLEAMGAPGESIEVDLSRADVAPNELRTWSDQPRSRYPRLSARLTSDSAPARLDVTELLRAEGKSGEPWCLLLRAEPGSSGPLLVATGAAGGAAPRLDVYWE